MAMNLEIFLDINCNKTKTCLYICCRLMKQPTVIVLWPRFWELRGGYEGRKFDFHIALMYACASRKKHVFSKALMSFKQVVYSLIDMWMCVSKSW